MNQTDKPPVLVAAPIFGMATFGFVRTPIDPFRPIFRQPLATNLDAEVLPGFEMVWSKRLELEAKP